jgi:hypothetical protein
MFPESRLMFPESRRMFPESRRMFRESRLMFAESRLVFPTGLSCGMFLYVATIEVIAGELDGRKRDNELEKRYPSHLLWVRMWKFGCVVMGAGVVLLLLYAIGDEHASEGGDAHDDHK